MATGKAVHIGGNGRNDFIVSPLLDKVAS